MQQKITEDLQKSGYEVTCDRAVNSEAINLALEAHSFDIAIYEEQLPGINTRAALRLIHSRLPGLPVIVLSDDAGQEPALAAIRAGAADFVHKEDTQLLLRAIARELRRKKSGAAQDGALRPRSIFQWSVIRRSIGLLSTAIIPLILSLILFRNLYDAETQRIQASFETLARDRAHALEKNLEQYKFFLDSMEAFYRTSVGDEGESLSHFIQIWDAFLRDTASTGMGPEEENQSIAFILHVPSSERSAFEAQKMGPQQTNLEIHTLDDSGQFYRAPEKEDYFPIYSLNIPDGKSLIGLDLSSIPTMAQAMEQARDSGDLAITGLTPSLRNGSEDVIWLFKPLYEPTEMPQNIQERRDMLTGFLGMEIHLKQFVIEALGGVSSAGLNLYIYEYDALGALELLYYHPAQTPMDASRPASGKNSSQSVVAPATPAEAITWATDVMLGDRKWRILASPTPQFMENARSWTPRITLIAGLLVTALIIVVLLNNLKNASRIETIVAQRTQELSREVAKRQRAQAAIIKTNLALTERLNDLDRRSRQVALINEMGELMQACRSHEEAYETFAYSARQLFPQDSGGLYLTSNSRNFLKLVACWGNAQLEPTFAPDECWALRRGQSHLVTGSAGGLYCGHTLRGNGSKTLISQNDDHAGDTIEVGLLTGSNPTYLATIQGNASTSDHDRWRLCVPLMAQGETLGLFYLEGLPHKDLANKNSAESLETKSQLAATAAEYVSLALANLRLRETLRHQSIRDPLTHLFNRRFLEESMEREMMRAQRNQTPIGLLMIDIDHFKHFNDTFGHEAGDQVLQALGQLMQKHIRGEDIPCRFGGEEFMLILPGLSLEAARQRAEELRLLVSDMEVVSGDQRLGPIHISCGVSVYPQHGDTLETLMRSADAALYLAKQNGRNRVEIAE